MSKPTKLHNIDQLLTASGDKSTVGGKAGSEAITTRRWMHRKSQLRISQVDGRIWQMDACTFDFGVVLAQCRWEELYLRDCTLGREGTFTIEDCFIERLDIRNLKGNLSLQRCTIGQLVTHDSTSVSIIDARIASLKISSVSRSVTLANVNTGELEVLDCDKPGNVEIQIRKTSIQETAVVERCTKVTFTWHDSKIGAMRINKCSLLGGSFEGLEMAGQLIWAAVDTVSDQPTVLGGIFDGDILIDSTGRPRHLLLELRDVSARRSLRLRGNVRAKLQSGSIDGQLQQWQASHRGPSVLLNPDFRVEQVLVPDQHIGSLSTARTLAQNLLGCTDVNSLSTLRRSLVDRPRDQDQVYFAERCAGMEGASFALINFIKRWMFGFGVRFVEPAATLGLGIALTWLVIFILWATSVIELPGTPVSMCGLLQSGTLAAQLWFNVGAALPGVVSGTAWAVAAVACTMAGLVLTTTLIGIGIRRLVR